MQGEVDAEDIQYYYEDHQKIHNGLHHIMEIHEVLMQNHGWHISPIVAQKFLPIYSEPLLKIDEQQDYELNDSICFLCDCLQHGSQALFDQIQDPTGNKAIELAKHYFATATQEDNKFHLVQSCVFALGVIA